MMCTSYCFIKFGAVFCRCAVSDTVCTDNIQKQKATRISGLLFIMVTRTGLEPMLPP